MQRKQELLRLAKTYVMLAQALHNDGIDCSHYLVKARDCIEQIHDIIMTENVILKMVA